MSTVTKERPILFSAPMVRAILAGRKTMTRRVVRPQPDQSCEAYWRCVSSTRKSNIGTWTPRGGAIKASGEIPQAGSPVRCPYGAPGDRLWVRETWTPDHRDFYPHFPAVYKADGGYDYERNEKGEVYSPEQKSWYPYRWRPSIYMPRWASRIDLEVTAVRVERLHDCDDADAMAEGMHKFHGLELYGHDRNGTAGNLVGGSPREAFALPWESIHGAGAWDENPWVWVVGFTVLKGGDA